MECLKNKILSSYFFNEEHQLPVNKYIHNIRDQAIHVFKKQGFPSPQDEEWKYIHLAPLLNQDYDWWSSQSILLTHQDIQPYILGDSDRLVFVDGKYNFCLSHTSDKQHKICILSEVFSFQGDNAVFENYYSKLIPNQDGLIALNTAFSQDGAYIYIPEGVFMEKPLQILYFSTGGGSLYTFLHPRNLVILGKGSRMKIIERHHAIGHHVPFSNSVTEIYTHAYSQLEYYKIQDDISDSSLIDNTFISQDLDSQCLVHTWSFGGKLVRNNLNIYQCDQHAHVKLNGLSVLQGESLVDHHTLIDHQTPYTESHEMYKGIFQDNSKGVFNGKIIVRAQSKRINAFQTSKNILLSRGSSIQAKPQLEIFSDDVRCSHGCTVGQLNPGDLFYLRTRGIPEKQARAQLLFAFAREVLPSITISTLKAYLHRLLATKLNANLEFDL